MLKDLTKLASDGYGRITVYTDNEEFIVKFIGGHAETKVTIGYSCPNGANIGPEYLKEEQVIELKEYCQDIINNYSHTSDDMIPSLFSIVNQMNSKYNDLIFS